MNLITLSILRPLVSALMIGVLCAGCLGQGQKSISEADVRELIKKSLSKDYKIADEANQTLSKLTRRDLSTLAAISKRGSTCERMKAAQAIIDIDKENKPVIPILVHLSTGGNASETKEDLVCRRGATFLLAFSTEGIRNLTGMLKDGKNLFIRQSAIFAFDELTETANYPDGSLDAMKAAIPIIAESRNLEDEVMQRMANEVLWQIVRRGNNDLSRIAKKFVTDPPL